MTVGEIIGLAIAGFLADRYGWKPILTGMMVMLTCCLFLFAFIQNLGMMVAAMVLCGEYHPGPLVSVDGADHCRYPMGRFPNRLHCVLF